MEPDRSVRLLTALEGSASTARVLNLVATHRKYPNDPDVAQAPFFKNRLLDRAIILKHRLRPNEYGLFQSPRPTATKVMLPMDHSDLRAGAQTFFVGQRDFDRLTESAFGADLKAGTRDRRVLDLIDSLPSLDPFLLRESLRANEVEQKEIMALVTLSSSEGAISSSARLVEKLLSNSPDSGFEPLRLTLKLNEQEYQDGVFSWRGFLYYKWVLSDLNGPIARVVREIGSINPRGPASVDAAQYIPDAKRRLQAAGARTVRSAQKMLDVYNDSYAALTQESKPNAFRDFLLSAPSMFSDLGEALGAIQHIVSFWTYRFPHGRPRIIQPDELMDVLLDFEDSLSMSSSPEPQRAYG